MDLGGLTPEQQQRLSSMLQWYERYGAPDRTYQPVATQPSAFIPTFIGKATSTTTGGGSGSAELWSSTAGSTVAETATGSTVTVHDWIGAGCSSGDKLTIWRHARSGRLYFAGPTEVKAVTNSSIAADDSGTVTIWKNGGASTRTVTAHLNWLHGGNSISSSGIELLIRYYPDETKWVIVEREC